MRLMLVAILIVGAGSSAVATPIAADIARQLPRGYSVLSSAKASFGGRTFYLVALRSRKEQESQSYLTDPDRAPSRPFIIYERTAHGVTQVGRNDHVINRAGDGGVAGNGCDPFEDGSIAVKGSYFTVENSISCGAHWTDYVTFRFDARRGYVFDNERFQSWKLNPSRDPNAEALIPDVQRVLRPPKGRTITFSEWRPPN